MASMAVINVNVDAKTKEQANLIFKDLGLNMSTAINMFLTQVVKRDGIPFEITNPKPSRELLEALEESEQILNGRIERKGYHNAEDMVMDIINED